MGVGDSIIRVSIIGDATKLNNTLKGAQGNVGGFDVGVKKLAAGLVGLGAVSAGFDFLKDTSTEADRLGDSMQRLNTQLGTDLAAKVHDLADEFTSLGLSTQDVQELVANFADLGTAIGITDDKLVALGPTVVATAQSLSLLGKGDTASLVDAIGKAAGGSAKAAKTLGVTLLDTKDAGVQLDNILKQLKPNLDAATTGTGDLEQKQAAMQARIETLQGEIGEQLNPVLAEMLGFIDDEIKAIPHAIEGFQMLADKIAPLLTIYARLNDILQNTVGLLGQVSEGLSIQSGANIGTDIAHALGLGRTSESGISQAQRNYNNRNGLGSHGV